MPGEDAGVCIARATTCAAHANYDQRVRRRRRRLLRNCFRFPSTSNYPPSFLPEEFPKWPPSVAGAAVDSGWPLLLTSSVLGLLERDDGTTW